MHVDIHGVTHATCRQLGASINLTFSGPYGEITLYLPEKMLACATMIVGAFNAHMSGETIAEGVERVTEEQAYHTAADKAWKEPDTERVTRKLYDPTEHWPNKPLTIEAGKYYRTRGGRKVGPMKIGSDLHWPWNGRFEDTHIVYRHDGRSFSKAESAHDLIAEWTDTPSETAGEGGAE